MKNTEKSKDTQQRTYCFSADSDNNAMVAIGAEKWAYKDRSSVAGSPKRKHGSIKPGDYIMVYTKTTKVQSGGIRCVGMVMSYPEVGKAVTDLWSDGPYYDPFEFKVIIKGFILLEEVRQILGTTESLNTYLGLQFADVAAKITSEEVAKISNAMR